MALLRLGILWLCATLQQVAPGHQVELQVDGDEVFINSFEDNSEEGNKIVLQGDVEQDLVFSVKLQFGKTLVSVQNKFTLQKDFWPRKFWTKNKY